jgi:hypothetical protein
MGKKVWRFSLSVVPFDCLTIIKLTFLFLLSSIQEGLSMKSSIVRGMPYATMQYIDWPSQENGGGSLLPTIGSEIKLSQPVIADGNAEIHCTAADPIAVRVDREVELVFGASDFTWLVFTSEPVMMHCILDEASGGMRLQVVDFASPRDEDSNSLVLRVALLTPCTSGRDPANCKQEQMHPNALHVGEGNYHDILRAGADSFPGPNTSFSFTIDEQSASMELKFDWDVQHMAHHSDDSVKEPQEIITFALPHHVDILDKDSFDENEMYCAQSLLGPACLITGSSWTMVDEIPVIGFRAPRSPEPQFLRQISESLRKDLNFSLPAYYRRGAGDTYFSGKMLAKLGRIVVIADELLEICTSKDHYGMNPEEISQYKDACKTIWLPSKDYLKAVKAELRSSVEVWINGTAETPFVFDPSWGGVVSCGCRFNEKKGECENRFPDCPAFSDPGLNFGNAFYNDMHFHYGYHIYAAAVVAHFDPEWGRQQFENVLLLVRTIGNPDNRDEFFTTWRHKDWFQGHSWASGIATTPLNGRNQESSSEAIAAYEAVALYGAAMRSAWQKTGSAEKLAASISVQEAGQVMLASELRSTRRYWHVHAQTEGAVKIFPSTYKPHVIGIMWQTMAQFQTWFGGAAYLAYGIQLLPFTSISEQRDGVEWSKSMYTAFASSCEDNQGCKDTGWKILLLGMLATVGHQDLAVQGALDLRDDVFEDPGGNGHSLSNTLWYIATRPKVDEPVLLGDNHTQQHQGNHGDEPLDKGECLPCSQDVCDSPLNRCPRYEMTFICIKGSSRGGCSGSPWDVSEGQYCSSCCELTDCPELTPVEKQVENIDDDSNCPQCSQKECLSKINLCPAQNIAPFLCLEGSSTGGCSPSPWSLGDDCSRCCRVLPGCPK